MYIADIVTQFRARTSHALCRSSRALPSTVYALGFTSLLTDVSVEMVASILPVYLLVALRLSPTQYGLVDGLFRGGAAIAALLLGGVLTRGSSRAKRIAGAGYAFSAASKLVLLASGAVGAITCALAMDRLGKGLRTAPRDAILAAAVPPGQFGVAFGVHRAMDAVGALAGPVFAAFLLWLVPNGYRTVFSISSVAAMLGVWVFHRFVRSPDSVFQAVPTLRSWAGLQTGLARIVPAPCRRLLALSSLLTLFTVSEGLIYAHVQRSFELEPSMQPLLPVCTAAAFLFLAAPAGWLADRVGAARVFVSAHGLLLGVCALLAFSSGETASPWMVPGLLVALGAFFAGTDGVLMAALCTAVSIEDRAMTLAVFGAILAAMKLLSSALFGWLWDHLGVPWASATYAAGLLLTLFAFWTTKPFHVLAFAAEAN